MASGFFDLFAFLLGRKSREFLGISGPFYVDASQMYVGQAKVGEIYPAGSRAGEIFAAEPQVGEVR